MRNRFSRNMLIFGFTYYISPSDHGPTLMAILISCAHLSNRSLVLYRQIQFLPCLLDIVVLRKCSGGLTVLEENTINHSFHYTHTDTHRQTDSTQHTHTHTHQRYEEGISGFSFTFISLLRINTD